MFFFFIFFFFFSSRRRHTRCGRDWSSRRVLFRSDQVRTLPNGQTVTPRWIQFRIPVSDYTGAIGGISDMRSIRFSRMYLKEFSEKTVFRFGTLDLVRSDWRRYGLTLDEIGRAHV